MQLRDQQILHLALPSILSNITVPLLGLIDVAIVGHMGSANYIGAIAVGGMAFNIIYWIFAFLRMGTSGLTAQALGRRSFTDVIHMFIRSLVIGFSIAFVLLLMQYPLREIIYRLISPDPDIYALATTYFNICIWGAPATLGLYSLTGWFIGMQNTRAPMVIAIAQNIINILASLCLVFGLGMKIEGVALGTVIAQYAGLLMGLGIWRRHYLRLQKYIAKEELWKQEELSRFFHVNKNIFLRTFCLVAVMLYFTSAGAQQGELILAANTILMELYLLVSYVMDGFAFAGEALGGRFIGAQHQKAFDELLRRLTFWSSLVALAFTLVYVLLGKGILHLLTDEQAVISTAMTYLYGAALVAITGAGAFILDGIFIGATATRDMLLSVFLSTLLFFVLYFLLRDVWGNHGLWLAYNAYLASRGLVLYLRLGKLRRDAFGRPHPNPPLS